MKKRFMVPVGVAALALATSANSTTSPVGSSTKEKIDTTHNHIELAKIDLSSESVVDEIGYKKGNEEHLLLMKRSERGNLFAAHGSHSSHGSHGSHRSGS